MLAAYAENVCRQVTVWNILFYETFDIRVGYIV